MSFDPERVLFIGLGQTAVGWYRCYMPAMFMGADWAALAGQPPKLRFATSYVKRSTTIPNFGDYDVFVIQQPRGKGWLGLIRDLQRRGKKVLFEVDDYLHAIRKMEDHDFNRHFSKRDLKGLEVNMRACDGLICSTEFIARRYRAFNKRVWVCENGVDMGRYRLTRPSRPTVNIGWAGATGHTKAAVPWFREVYKLMHERPNTACVTIGQDFAGPLTETFGPRAISIPFTLLDSYPAAMTMFDVAIAPAGKGLFFRGKSDLRWLEAGALGIPIVADPTVYPKIEHRVNGFHAATAEEAHDLLLELVDDDDLRIAVGENARRYVEEHRDMRIAVRQWERVFADLALVD